MGQPSISATAFRTSTSSALKPPYCCGTPRIIYSEFSDPSTQLMTPETIALNILGLVLLIGVGFLFTGGRPVRHDLDQIAVGRRPR